MNEKIREVAKECGASFHDTEPPSLQSIMIFDESDLTRFAIRMKQEALLEAAGVLEKNAEEYSRIASDAEDVADQFYGDCSERATRETIERLRRMAEQLGKRE